MRFLLHCLLAAFVAVDCNAFAPGSQYLSTCKPSSVQYSVTDAWKGEVVSNSADGRIGGCSILQVDGSDTEWTIKIDGVEADLGRFSEAIYKKLLQDAKQQRFQGFRPGTVPPHLLPTYITYAMDECARETVMEAMSQNNIRPFESARMEMQLSDFVIPPPIKNKTKKKSKKKRAPTEGDTNEEPAEPQWTNHYSMQAAIDAGWKPGQSFSFLASKVKGQKLKDDSGAAPLGLNY